MNKKLILALMVAVTMTGNIPVVFATEVPNKGVVTVAKDKLETQGVKVRPYTLHTLNNYDYYVNMYQISGVKSFKNNAGNYGSSSINKAFDGEVNTHWETNKPNSTSFKNEVIVEFDNIEKISRIVYSARKDAGNKGHIAEFSIYGSKTEAEDDFELVANSKVDKSSGLTELKFAPTDFKRLKLVFDKAHGDWASIGELQFLKEDLVLDAIGSIFTNSAKNEVSPEFASLDKLLSLEAQAKEHPFYAMIKEGIDNAIIILKSEDLGSVVASTGMFNHYNNEAYNKMFKLDNSNIKSIKANASHYGSQGIDKAIDNNLNTYWETNRANGSNFENEVVVEFKKAVDVNRVIFGARNDLKGFAREFEIYGSETTVGDTYRLISSGKAVDMKGLVEAKFDQTKLKRVKFRFKDSRENWATLSEIVFYSEDIYADKINTVFTNDLMNEVSPAFNTIEKIEAFEKEISNHPLRDEYLDTLQKAKNIINGVSNEHELTMELDMRGHSVNEARKRKLWSFKDWQVTGLTAKPGDKLEVYVDVEEGEPTPTLVWKQSINRHGNYLDIPLTAGKNVIVIPEYDNKRDDVLKGTIFGGALYFTNYQSDNQTRAPKVRIISGDKYPMYVHGVSDEKQVMEELRIYAEKVKADPENNVDLFDVSSDKAIVTVKATFADEWYRKNNKTPKHTADRWEFLLGKTYEFWGFDDANESELNKTFKSRMVFMTKNITGGTYMNASGGDVGIRHTSQEAVLSAETGWGIIHEIGHNMDTIGRQLVELTNNILPIYLQTVDNGQSILTVADTWHRHIYPKVTNENYQDNTWTMPGGGWDSYVMLAPLWQLHLNDNTFYGKFESVYRHNSFSLSGTNQVSESFVTAASKVYGEDLSEFFSRHGIHSSEKTLEYVSQFPKATKKYEYLNDRTWQYKGNGFTSTPELTIDSIVTPEKVTLNMSINEEEQDNVLGYEIIKDGKVIGFTANRTFVDTNVDVNKNSVYEVKPYDIKLGTGASVIINTLKPNLAIQQAKVIVGIGEVFNPLNYIKASNRFGENIIDRVQVESNVETTQKGIYTVKYTVTDGDYTMEKILQVEVASGYEYLSDREWTSMSTQRGRPRRNTNIKGRINGEIENFEKGMGIHAKGELVYDLGEHKYTIFEALVGVDGSLKAQDNSSVTFEIIGDGEVLATTGTLRHSDNMVLVSVPVTGVKELKIVVGDSRNGNTSDHGMIVNPKLVTQDTKPNLVIGKNVAVKLREDFNIMEGVMATDTEDGDLTSRVALKGEVDFKQPGRYAIDYTVVDSDGNEVTATRTISVVDMRDFTFVSDYDWKSASCGWGSIKKDQSPSEKAIRLTDENNQEVVFEKGLGTHATSAIVYDLTKIDAQYFSAYVGVDRAMRGSVGQVGFELWLDGEKVAETGNMNARDTMKYMEINIEGAKELKLVAHDGGNGNGSDHAVWGDTKFHYANTDRVITDTVKLKEFVAICEALNQELHTEESLVAFNKILVVAKELLVNQDATQEAVDAMLNTLIEAKEALILKGNKEPILTLIKEIYLLDSSKYTEESWLMVAKAIAAAEEVIDNPNATQTQIDEALLGLQSAKSSLGVIGDKSVLRELIQKVVEELKGMDLSKYTLESVQAVQVAIEEGEELLGTSSIQEDIDAMTIKLEEVRDTARISESKEALAKMLERAFDAKYDQYDSSPMWEDYKHTREVYKANLESVTTFTELEIQVMAGFMEQAMEMLEAEI